MRPASGGFQLIENAARVSYGVMIIGWRASGLSPRRMLVGSPGEEIEVSPALSADLKEFARSMAPSCPAGTCMACPPGVVPGPVEIACKVAKSTSLAVP